MSSLSLMVILLLTLPSLGSVVCLFIPSNKPKLISIIASVFSFLTLCLAIILNFYSSQTEQTTVGWNWFYIGSHTITLSFEFNQLTIPLMVIVAVISFLVHVYSIGFLEGDKSRPRYFSTLGLFTFSMLGLTLSGNLFQLFIFWELVALCSYLLIGYYRHKPEAAAAATKSFIMNKIGDAGFLIVLMLLWVMGGTFEISALETSHFIKDAKPVISAFILLAIFSKSAQFPFHKWLIDAMEGPTPVSALIHSATMVAAGVFLMARLHFLFTPVTLQVAAIIGATTALIGGVNALRENDLKKLLAWSTLSQLGLMIMVAGNSGFNASFVHLLSHAIFKAGLFLTAGIILSRQDVLPSGQAGLKTSDNSPSGSLKTAIVILCLSLMGFPFTIGFFSKESMLASLDSPVFIGIFFLVNLLTSFYTVRIVSITVTFKKIYDTQVIAPLLIARTPPLSFGEGPEVRSIAPVVLLAIACLWIFYSLSPLNSSWANLRFDLDEPSTVMTWASLLWVLGGSLVAFAMAQKGKLNWLAERIPIFSFDRILGFLFARPVLILAEVSNRTDIQILDRGLHFIAYVQFGFALLMAWLDRVILDGVTDGLGWLTKSIGNLLRQFVAGKIQDYIWWTLLAVMILIVVMK